MKMLTALERTLADGRGVRRSAVERFFREAPSDVHHAFRRELLALEKAAMSTPDPLRLLRSRILDFTEEWKVTELIGDIRADNDDAQFAQKMEEILAPHYVEIRKLESYFTNKLSALVLRRYTATTYCDSARHDWWDVFVESIIDHVVWLHRAVKAQHRTGRTDTALLDKWKELRAKARRRAIECPVGVTQYPIRYPGK